MFLKIRVLKSKRNLKGNKKDYAFEELIAELGSAFLCSKLGIEKDIKNTSAYIQSWLNALENDTQFIFKASKQAQKVWL